MQRWDTVAIVGVGLIGGSIGLALRRKKLARRVIGIGRSSASLAKAKRRGLVDATTTNLSRGVSQAELVVVCTPVGLIVEHVLATAENCPPGTLITDAGSTKTQIVSALDHDLGRGVAFVGSHPLAGSEKVGPAAAQEDLLKSRTIIVTPTGHTAKKHVAAVTRFWQSLGARVEKMTPQAHDEAIAAISHLPHVVASALAAATPKKHLPLAATGFLDTTRIAAGDVQLWQQILSENRVHTLRALDKFEKVLASFRDAVERDDTDALKALLDAGKRNRDSLGS